VTTPQQLWLVRHGETEWARSGRHTGRTDLPLTPEGERQARAIGAYLGGRSFALVLVSPLRRALDTCRLAGYGDVARPTADLAEWDYGRYEGRLTSEVRAEVPGWTIWDGGVPGGETAEQVAERTRRVLAEATAARGDVALFAHGHVLRVLTACWLGLPPTAGGIFAFTTGACCVLGREHERPVVVEWNRVP
jgi:probable phosphoglycerate mutase